MGHYYHIHYTLVLKDLSKEIIEMLDIQEQYYYCDRYVNQTKEQTEKRCKEAMDRSKAFELEMIGGNTPVAKFITKWDLKWDYFLLYEADQFEWVPQGTEYPGGWESSGTYALHGNFDTKEYQIFPDFLEIIEPYIVSGSAWGWWEDNASNFEVYL